MNKPIDTITYDRVMTRHNQLEGGRHNKMRDGGLWAKPKRKKRMVSSDNLKDWYAAVLSLENEKAKDCLSTKLNFVLTFLLD
jgi:hypothetical protein